MHSQSHSLTELVLLISGAGLIMACAKWMISKEPFVLRFVLGRAIINTLTGMSALTIIIAKPNIPDWGLFGLAIAVIVIGPIVIEEAAKALIKNKLS